MGHKPSIPDATHASPIPSRTIAYVFLGRIGFDNKQWLYSFGSQSKLLYIVVAWDGYDAGFAIQDKVCHKLNMFSKFTTTSSSSEIYRSGTDAVVSVVAQLKSGRHLLDLIIAVVGSPPKNDTALSIETHEPNITISLSEDPLNENTSPVTILLRGRKAPSAEEAYRDFCRHPATPTPRTIMILQGWWRKAATSPQNRSLDLISFLGMSNSTISATLGGTGAMEERVWELVSKNLRASNRLRRLFRTGHRDVVASMKTARRAPSERTYLAILQSIKKLLRSTQAAEAELLAMEAVN